MKVPVSWLKEWVPLRVGVEEIAHRLTFAGFEVEAIEDVDGEKVLVINVTANRGDALSIVGIARELSALFKVRPTKIESRISISKEKGTIPVHLQNARSCPRYALAVIDGVSVRPADAKIQKRLEQVGVRSINNIVDVTNYVLMELGQPLHAFDLKKISQGKISIRNAKEGEKLTTLDEIERSLKKEDLVIADGEGPMALAGIMGGADSSVDEGTTAIALECAFFDPDGIRKTARRLGIQSESSYRFERRVDPEGIPAALQKAIQMILESAGGRLVSVVDLYPKKVPTAKVRFVPQEVSKILGGKWTDREIEDSLKRLSFRIQKRSGASWEVTAPSYRGDLERPADLIEEVARIQGLEKIPTSFPPLKKGPIVTGASWNSWDRKARHLLADLGLQETIHYSFISQDLIRSFFGQDSDNAMELASLANPLGQDQAILRPSLLPSLVQAAAYHHRYKIFNFRAFELRKGFGEKGERKLLAGLMSGQRPQAHWGDREREVDYYDVKGIVERLLGELGYQDIQYVPATLSYLHPGKSATIMVGGQTVGVLGELHPDLVDRFELKGRNGVFELEWDFVFQKIWQKRRSEVTYHEFSKLPVVERDLALVLDEGTPAATIRHFIQSQDVLVQEVNVFDLYRGNQVPVGKKSLAFSVRVGRSDRTMTEQEIQELFDRVIGGLKQKFQAEVR